MTRFLTRFAAIIFPTVLASLSALGQSNPTPQTLPYTQGFGSNTFNSMPAGMAAWTAGANRTTQAAAEGAAPAADALVTPAASSQSTGGVYGYATGSNARAYIQQSSNATNGTSTIAVAFDTGSATAVSISYDLELINGGSSTQDFGHALQYRQGSTGSFTTIAGSAMTFGAVTSYTTTTRSFTLPGLSANTAYQLRWITWRPSGSGTSKGIGIDNISITGVGALSASVTPTSVSEAAGDNAATLTVTRSGSTAAELQLNLSINDPTEAAYDGPNPLTMAAGQSSATFAIRAVDDDGTDGDQTVTLTVSAPGFAGASATLIVTDNEDPYSPPVGYYTTAQGLTGTALKATLKTIASPATYFQYAYSNTYTPLRKVYEDPNNTANVITVYSGTSLGKTVNFFPGGPSADTSWSREHVWPESYGLDTTNVNPGSTDGDAGPDFVDLFNLRPCIQTVNSQRGNKYYDISTGTISNPTLAPLCSTDSDSWQPRDVEKGDLARSIFYMAMRYDGSAALTMDLEVSETPNATGGVFGKLSTLLRWNNEDPVSLEERQRNQLIFSDYQKNRNPFIDHPEYIALIWGGVNASKYAAAVTEGGATDSYAISLASQPTADVTISLSTTPASQITVSPTSVTFTSTNWDIPQSISITAVDDAIYEAAPVAARIVHTVSSADSRYGVLQPNDVVATVSDNDPQIAAQALPISYGGPWSPLPNWLLGASMGSPYGTELVGDTSGGSARFDSAPANSQLTFRFASAPATLSFRIKGNPSTGSAVTGTFLIQESATGSAFTTVATIVNKDSSDQLVSYSLNPLSRYVSFTYSKTNGNIQFDRLAVTAAPAFTSWASDYGLAGSDAAGLLDYDGDGLPNLIDYAYGASPIAADAANFAPALGIVGNKLRITAVVRSSDANLTVGAQARADLADGTGWTSNGVTAVTGVDQTGVASGFTRVAFEVDAGTQKFMRLLFTLNPAP